MPLKPYSVLRLVSIAITYSNRLSGALTHPLGCCVFALTTPLLLAIPDAKADIESRPVVWLTMLAGELLLIPSLMW